MHSALARTPRDKVFARWYGDKGQVESIQTFHGLWTAAGEVRESEVIVPRAFSARPEISASRMYRTRLWRGL